MPTDDFDAAWRATKADLEAADILLRGLTRAQQRGRALRLPDIAGHIREELDAFRAQAEEPVWRELVCALVEASVDELLNGEQPPGQPS